MLRGRKPIEFSMRFFGQKLLYFIAVGRDMLSVRRRVSSSAKWGAFLWILQYVSGGFLASLYVISGQKMLKDTQKSLSARLGRIFVF